MIKIIFILTSVVLLVIANPLPQAISIQTCPYQQHGYYNQPLTIPVVFQQPTTNNNPSNQPVLTQNQAQSQENPSNNNINQILVSKILSNPSLQKILDPNTKLYNQNGVEIKRQVPNTGVVPNVINNYFIVPPEFLNLNETCLKKDVSKPKKIIRSQNDRAEIQNNERNVRISTSNGLDSPESCKPANVENNVKKNEDDIKPIHERNSNTDKRKRNRDKNSTQSKSESEIDNDNVNDTERPKTRRNKRKRKKEKQNNDETPIEIVKEETGRKTEEEVTTEDSIDKNTNAKKRRRKPRPNINNENEYSKSAAPEYEEIVHEKVSSKLEKETKQVQDIQEKSDLAKDNKIKEIVDNDRSQLKDIEKPIDNTEHEQDPLENRLTRNSKNETSAKNVRWNYAGSPKDNYMNFFPYMPFYANGNFPLSYDQFFQSLQLANSGRNDSIRRRKQKRNRKNQSNQNQQQTRNVSSNLNEKGELNSLVTTTEATVKPLVQSGAETLNKQITNLAQIELNSKSAEQVREIPMEVPHKVSPARVVQIPESVEEHEFKPLQKDQNYKIYDYMVSELDTEDVLPTIHRNGIINDYYPVFNDDDAYLSDNEDYFVKNLENDRFFYTTDRNTERNRDRRKHESLPNEDRETSIYSRDRTRNINQEKDEVRSRYRELEELSVKKPPRTDNIQNKARRPVYESEEIEFRSPPILEFPDFRTKKVEKDFTMPDDDNYDEIERFDDDFADKSSSYSNVKTPLYNTRVKPNTEVKRVRISSRNSKPKINNVETVFARSKVAKYGQISDESVEESSTPTSYYEERDPQHYNDDGTTYVVAKSLYQDDYW